MCTRLPSSDLRVLLLHSMEKIKLFQWFWVLIHLPWCPCPVPYINRAWTKTNESPYPQLMSIVYSRSTGVFLCGCSSVFHWLKIPSQFLFGDQLISQSIRFKLSLKVHFSTFENAEIMKIQVSQVFSQFFQGGLCASLVPAVCFFTTIADF